MPLLEHAVHRAFGAAEVSHVVVEGDRLAFKITTPDDLATAERHLSDG
jgi:2-C-methyl-D-erythritol 4-phosphate cytidylyltransferase